MKSELVGWLAHPVTLALAGVVLMALLLNLEILSRRLAEIGNVRFQGMLEDHQSLFPFAGKRPLHLSRLLDALRWLEIGVLWLLWLVCVHLPGVSDLAAMGLALATWAVTIFLGELVVGLVTEETTARLLRLVRPLALPVVTVLARDGKRAVAPTEDEEEEASEREIQAFLDVGEAAGIFEGEEGEFVESLVDFFDTTVREVMTPRTDMVAVADTATFKELVAVFAETRRSRIPVYHDTIDHILGVVHVKAVVEDLVAGHEPSVANLLRECPVVPESKKLGELLREFQGLQQQMAIVVDEYGGTAGLVTLEDILEEIVGEIQDEHEPKQPPEWQALEGGVYRLQGRAPLEVLEELFDAEVHEGEVDTVGGLVFARYGTVPEAGATVKDDELGLEFTVEAVDERRIQSVLVRRVMAERRDDRG